MPIYIVTVRKYNMTMKNTIDYLDEVTRQHPGITNDSQLAHFLDITRQAISNYRKGQQMSVTVALRIAQVLELHPMETISATMYQQSQDNHTNWGELWKTEFNTYGKP